MKYWISILVPTLLLIAAPKAQAHDLITVSGDAQDHQHVYRRQEYGKPLQQGHVFQSPGGASMIVWEAGTRSDYGKLNSRRNGPIIGKEQFETGGVPRGGRNYGSAVNDYGRPLDKYGKPVTNYRKPGRDY